MKKKELEKKEKRDWFRIKKYPHIGMPFQVSSRNKWIEEYVKDEEKIARHAFFPFIHRKSRVRKFRREINDDGSRSKLRKPGFKDRELYYANHLDSTIYSYYAEVLQEVYENQLLARGLSECVTAYRRVKLNNNENSRNKCNMDFASDVFTYIKESRPTKLVALTFDIKKFFDTLNHVLLKKYWKVILDIPQEDELPAQHYNVFRNLTKFSYVEEKDIFNEFKNEILVARASPIDRKRTIKSAKIAKLKYLKNKRSVAFCTKKDILRIRKKGLIKSNKYELDEKGQQTKVLRKKGIPQGSPISSVLANVYMLDFDRDVNDFISQFGGLYRRYSDDMIVVSSIEYEKQIIDFFRNTIKKYCLEIQETKTQCFHFTYDSKAQRYFCWEKNLKTTLFLKTTQFEYLGFQFDGKITRLKNASLARFYRKMKKNFARGRFYTFHNNTNTKGILFKARLYKRFTHVGAQRRRIYVRDKKHKDRFNVSNKYDWGNFLTYANLAARVIPDNGIKNQVKRSWKIFHELMKDIEKPRK
ncbi:reverse transcriptase domain-containing protein [Xanthocytophaga flava]|uniref:reverse transcriptase domain-containing protein n=1 Tax=Xanthocytophaga flava TaxID=3048013 RepID=UPI0028D51DCB|nr:reverse transcriptase domain-containing protein [Xanthocytophaga flavus]MDJ1473549.1 reverse transcriptase domain-containing protein [Xanthocytophaga flavus]